MGGYLPYSLFLLVLLAACLLLFILSRRQRQAKRVVKLADRARKRRQRRAGKAGGSPGQLPNHKAVLRRELKKVPTPWGWPGSGVRHENHKRRGANGGGTADDGLSLRRWIDYLFAPKKTVDEEEYRSHRNAALRSMVEDRYGQPSRPAAMPYRKVIPPRLRDPDLPHDQMDNFPSGRTETITNRLAQQSGGQRVGQVDQQKRARPALREIKKPWGW